METNGWEASAITTAAHHYCTVVRLRWLAVAVCIRSLLCFVAACMCACVYERESVRANNIETKNIERECEHTERIWHSFVSNRYRICVCVRATLALHHNKDKNGIVWCGPSVICFLMLRRIFYYTYRVHWALLCVRARFERWIVLTDGSIRRRERKQERHGLERTPSLIITNVSYLLLKKRALRM